MPACERSPGPFRLRENICSGQDFSCQDIDHTVLSGCRFELVDFSDALLEYCTFEACVFNACKLNGVLLKNCAFVNCTFPYSGFFAAEFHQCKMTGSSFAGASCAGVLIKGGDWSYTDLRELDFSHMRLSGVSFEGA
ncbi:MAG: pentapeptide repeat-containing protein, partial [Clostridiales bacterium]|nr:pentapeptide repeat-containing protein [Clostridiales bacterium]